LLRQSLRVSIGDRKSQNYMNKLIKYMSNVLRASGNAEEVAEAAAFAAWKHAAGDGLKDHAVPLKLENRTLTVSVADLIWQKQLHSMRGQLLFRINSTLGQPLVSTIEFVIDQALAKKRAAQTRAKEAPLDNEVPLELWSAANAIQDKELRRSFLKAATVSLRRRARKS
jgi:predicted nucleic acid-binding Zn ribbon protein